MNYSEDVWKAVIADMEQRRDLGIEIYGKPVEAGDFDAAQYLYEELLDAVVYVKTYLLAATTLDTYQGQVSATDSKSELATASQEILENSNLQKNLALALKSVAEIAKYHQIKLSDLI